MGIYYTEGVGCGEVAQHRGVPGIRQAVRHSRLHIAYHQACVADVCPRWSRQGEHRLPLPHQGDILHVGIVAARTRAYKRHFHPLATVGIELQILPCSLLDVCVDCQQCIPCADRGAGAVAYRNTQVHCRSNIVAHCRPIVPLQRDTLAVGEVHKRRNQPLVVVLRPRNTTTHRGGDIAPILGRAGVLCRIPTGVRP